MGKIYGMEIIDARNMKLWAMLDLTARSICVLSCPHASCSSFIIPQAFPSGSLSLRSGLVGKVTMKWYVTQLWHSDAGSDVVDPPRCLYFSGVQLHPAFRFSSFQCWWLSGPSALDSYHNLAPFSHPVAHRVTHGHNMEANMMQNLLTSPSAPVPGSEGRALPANHSEGHPTH